MSHIAEYIDRVATVEMRPGTGNAPHGQMHRLYEAARERNGAPLVLSAARCLVDAVAPDDAVLIVTGAGCDPMMPNGEVDGLLGTAALARVLIDRLGARVAVLAEARCEPPLRATIRAAGLNVRGVDEDVAGVPAPVTFVATSLAADECEREATEIIDRFAPAAIVAIEKLGPNERGAIHGSTGLGWTDEHTKPQFVFELAAERGIPTVGIGDGGNEVGFGVIADAVADIIPAGHRCQCPCGGRTGTSVATDHLIVAAISNWGAYALGAMLCELTGGDLAGLIDEDDLERMLRACVDAGALDGAFSRPSLTDDGVPLQTHRAFVTMLRSIVTIGNSHLTSPGH